MKRVAAGDLVVDKVSRTVLSKTCGGLCNVRVVLMTAPPDVGAARIAARGRERGIQERLARTLRSDLTARRSSDMI